jgi:hypothetical protein
MVAIASSAAEGAGQGLGRFGLPDAGLALQQQWLGKAHGAEERGGEPRVGQVVGAVECGAEGVDVGHQGGEIAHDRP